MPLLPVPIAIGTWRPVPVFWQSGPFVFYVRNQYTISGPAIVSVPDGKTDGESGMLAATRIGFAIWFKRMWIKGNGLAD